jgi:hypothetical protein
VPVSLRLILHDYRLNVSRARLQGLAFDHPIAPAHRVEDLVDELRCYGG